MKFSLSLGALSALAFALAGCQQPTDETTFKTRSLTVTSTSTTVYKYYDLDTGAEVTDAASKDWDIAFTSSTGGVFTNSGATATKVASGGVGGVSYAGTDFKKFTNRKKVSFDEAFTTDTTVSVITQGQNGPVTSTTDLNQMTKLDYSGGTGTSADPYSNDASAGVYDGEAYYLYSAGVISASGEIYLIRHGDGKGYSKLQITSISGTSASRERVIKYANF